MAKTADWKFEHRVLSLAKMGFPQHEAAAAIKASQSGEVMAHDTLCRLLEPFRPARTSTGSGERSTSGSSSPSLVVRQEEEEVLRAIFGDEAFRVVRAEGTEVGERWEVDLDLDFDGESFFIAPETTIRVLFQHDRRLVYTLLLRLSSYQNGQIIIESKYNSYNTLHIIIYSNFFIFFM